MSTPRYISEYLTAHPEAHRDEVIDRLGYDFEHETVRGPVYDSWGESVMDEHNCLELREELQELLASFKTEDSKAAYEIARLGLNPQQLTEYRTSISSFVTSCLDAYEPKLTDFIVEAVDPEEEVRPAGSLRVQFLDGYGDRLVGTYVRLAPAAANSSPDQPLRMELSREMVIENSEGYESPDMLPSVRHAVQRHLLTHYDQIREEAIAVSVHRNSRRETSRQQQRCRRFITPSETLPETSPHERRTWRLFTAKASRTISSTATQRSKTFATRCSSAKSPMSCASPNGSCTVTVFPGKPPNAWKRQIRPNTFSFATHKGMSS